MSAQGPQRASQTPALTSLPRAEDIPVVREGYDQERVREAFDAFRRHAVQLHAQLRVLQAAGRGTPAEAGGHALRMDALHLIRAAAEFADTLERDAQNASATQFARAEAEIARRQRELQQIEAEIDRFRQESERQRAEVLNSARNEARELLANAHREAAQELRDAEARAARLLEQARHQATELTNATRAEVEQTLEWARAQAAAAMNRARQGAEQLLGAAGLRSEAMERVVEAIVEAARLTAEAARPAPPPPTSPAAVVADSPGAVRSSEAPPAPEVSPAPAPGLGAEDSHRSSPPPPQPGPGGEGVH